MSFYAVKVGKVPGIYSTWAETSSQVTGYPAAKFKKFATEELAIQFLTTGDTKPIEPGRTRSPVMPDSNYYPLGSLATVPKASLSTIKTKSDLFKTKVETVSKPPEICIDDEESNDSVFRDQIEKAIRESLKGNGVTQPLPHLTFNINLNFADPNNCNGQVVCQSSTDNTCPMCERAWPSYKPKMNMIKSIKIDVVNSNKRKVDTTTPQKTPKNKRARRNTFVEGGSENCTHVYTDGACTENGRNAAKGGIGVWWGHGHPDNVSEPLEGRQTNNRAEIIAASRALEIAKERGKDDIRLYTDSQFLINGITKWIKGWKKNNWTLKDGGPVKNKEDFERLEEAKNGLKVEFIHVKGHSGIKGNEEADRLAVAAIKK